MKEVLMPAIEEGTHINHRKREDVAVSVTAFIATTPEEMNFARMQISFYASTPSYHSVMDLHGWADVAEKLSIHAAKAEWAEMPMLITDEMLAEFCLITSQEKLAEDLKPCPQTDASPRACSMRVCSAQIRAHSSWLPASATPKQSITAVLAAATTSLGILSMAVCATNRATLSV
jgi:alkanesulfonate monooxygenase SsuD/methylene tetrahydromethanopterin reductase-like flavin-dependent oxidoreductase (luciferase family)